MNILQVQQFKRGSIELVILSMINAGDTYGNEIIKALNNTGRFFSGARDGAIYPILHRLEENGFIKSRAERCGKRERTYYSITDAGRKELEEMIVFWKDYVSCVDSFIDS